MQEAISVIAARQSYNETMYGIYTVHRFTV
jgi:hypothetical protein